MEAETKMAETLTFTQLMDALSDLVEKTGDATVTPEVLVANGVAPGPTVCLTAAVHGDELNGMAIIDRLLERLETGAPVVIACGRDRRPELPDALADAGHPVVQVVVYTMLPTPPRELPPLPEPLIAPVMRYIDGIVHLSGGGPSALEGQAKGFRKTYVVGLANDHMSYVTTPAE